LRQIAAADAGGISNGGAATHESTIGGGCEDDSAWTTSSQSPREVLRNERGRILSLLAERGARDVRVFGSLARGDEDFQSDIDLLVSCRAGVRQRRNS
jgi:hypothetical protein